MTTQITCPKCGGSFSSTESYQNHIPCGDSSIVGGSGDVYSGNQETAKSGDGSN